MQPARVFGYARVSGREQGAHGTSLEGQREEIGRYCAARGYPSPQIRVEVESATELKIERRDELHALLAEARPGDLIVVSKVDRWSRDIVYCVQSVRRLVASGVGWHSIGEGIDASTPNGDSTLGIMAWVADQEHKRIRERTVGRRAALKDQGYYVEGPPPFGMRRGARSERQQLTISVEPSEAALVVEAFERCAAGSSVAGLVEWFQGASGRAWDKKSIHALLRNRVYLGEVKNASGAWIQGRVPQIVPRELYERAQAAMASRRIAHGPVTSATARTFSWLLRGLGTCPSCGARMGAEYGPRVDWYGCARRHRGLPCDGRRVVVQEVDPLASAMALARLRELRAELSAPPAGTKRRAARNFAAERARLAGQRERAVRLATQGTISDADLAAQLARLDDEGRKLDCAAEAATREAAARRPEARREVLADVATLERAWAQASVEQRREALKILAKRIVLRPEGPAIEWRSVEELAVERGPKA